MCTAESTGPQALGLTFSYLLLWFGDTMHSRKHGTTGSCSAYYHVVLTVCTAEKTGPQAFCPTYYCGLTMSTSESAGSQAFGLTYYRGLTMCSAKNRGPQAFCLTYYCGLCRKVHPESFFRSCLLCIAYSMKLGQKCSE